MKTPLGRLMVVTISLALFALLPMASDQQPRTSGSAAAASGLTFPVEETTIAQLHAAYLAGKTTAHDVTQAYIDRIAAYDKSGPYLNSLISINTHALADADARDAALKATGKLTGPLHGIPVIVKDNLDTIDMPTSSGVALFKDFVPAKDAFVVARLRAAGAIVLAKSSLSELAMGLADSINSVLPGFTRNPYNTAFASGGSSGGTGVAIAANFATVGIGTDTGGSVRAPSSINNLVGIRPTVGLVSRTGMGPLDSQRDTPGPMGRSVEDVARLLDVMAGVDSADARTAPAQGNIPPTYTAWLDKNGLKGARIGVFRQTLGLQEGADPSIVALFDKAVADMRAAGAEIVEDFTVPAFETFPRPPQTSARTKADWERFLPMKARRFPSRQLPSCATRRSANGCIRCTLHASPKSPRSRCRLSRIRRPCRAARTNRCIATGWAPRWTLPA